MSISEVIKKTFVILVTTPTVSTVLIVANTLRAPFLAVAALTKFVVWLAVALRLTNTF